MTREDFSYESARFRALTDLTKVVIVPAVVLTSLLKVTNVQLGYYTIPCCGLCIFIGSYLRGLYHNFQLGRDAKRLVKGKEGSVGSIPVVKAMLPGGIDLIIRAFANKRSGYVHDVFLEWFEECQSTTIAVRTFGVDRFVTMDAEHLKFLMVTGHANFSRGDAQKEVLETFLGSGILNRDGDMWKAHRTTTRPFLANDRTSDLGLFDKYINRALNHISNLEPNQAIDFEDLAARFTIDTSSEFFFGHNLDTLSYHADGFDEFMDAFVKIQRISLDRSIRGDLWPLFEPFGDKSKKYGDILKQWVTPLVERALEHKRKMLEKGQSIQEDQCTLLEYLTISFDDVTVIRDQLMNMLLAARDTTSALLTYTVYMFTQHPGILARVREEVTEALGSDGTPTLEDIRKLKYLRAVLHETLRLFCPLHGSIRQSLDRGVVLPASDTTYNREPMYLPPNSPVFTFPLLLHRNEALWGPDAHVYDPDRWLDERLQRVTDNPSIYIPFGAGPRNCLGQNYAYNEASLFMIRFLQRFEGFTLAEDKQLPPPWKSNPESTHPPKRGMFGPGWPGSKRKAVERIWPGNNIVLHVKGGLWIRVKKAD